MKNKFALVLNCLAFSFFTFLTFNCQSQNTIPDHYWTFDGNNPLKDSLTSATLNTSTYNCLYTIDKSNNAGVGNSLKLDAQGKIIVVSQFSLDNNLTIEFLFKPDLYFNTTQFINRKDNAFLIKMGYPYIQFSTNILSSTGSAISNNLTIELEGIGRGTYGYYTDGNWHHLVFKYNTTTGKKEVWVDGQLPSGFSTTTATGTFNKNLTNTSNNDVFINTNTTYYKFKGNIDEIALYSDELSSNNIYKHYLNSQALQHYSFQNSTIVPPNAASVTSGIDANEFAPGHPTYTVNAIDQLKSFPLPRFKSTNTLQPNFNWIAMRYLAGEFQPGVSSSKAVSNSVELQKELAGNWNYYLMVSANTSTSTQYTDSTKFHGAWIKLANDNPQWPTSAISFWAQLNPSAFGYTANTGYIECKVLPSVHYLKNNAGQFLNLSGQVNSNKFWSPAAPLDSFKNDGLTQRVQMQRLLNALTRPLDFICENGEVIPKPSASAMALDPAIVNDKNAAGIADWDTYLGNRKARVATTYRDLFLNLPQLANTQYAEYQISGHPSTRHKYSETRVINKTFNGQRYATPDFYPRWPSKWATGSSAWNGWQHIIDGRFYELKEGDKLFSPFVAAGWNENEENNIRPAQWLGLMKCLGMLGTEYYFTGFFNEASSYQSPNPPPANPAGYVWQAAIPTYAQAITSQYEDLLRNGDLLPGDKPNNYGNPTAPGYSFEAGDARKLVVVRKHKTANIYAITGTIQPNSNMAGNTELESEATITLDGNKIQFKIRRQGSTYIYDISKPGSPVFYQLDGWHESSHPFNWSKDFNIEAELTENNSTTFNIATERPVNVASGDFRNTTSYVAFSGTTTALQYQFEPRTNAKLYFWVRARSANGNNTGLSISVNGTNQKSIGCIVDSTWQWYSIDACSNQAIFFNTNAQKQTLSISASNTSLEIDRVLLSIDPALQLNSNQSTCANTLATITASGPTSICDGDSVKLTASAGTSFQWSNGKTSQSITVTNSGNYNVTVTNSAGCIGTSTTVNVIIYNKPSPIIAATGATNFCFGDSVILTSTASSFYQWSSGETTQSITVNSTGNFQVTVTNNEGCTATSASTSVTTNALPVASISASGPLQFMAGNNVTLTANGGTTYLWSPGGETTAAINVNSPGTYQATVFSAQGCSTITNPVNVIVTPLIVANITLPGNQYICPGTSVTLQSDPAYAYSWSPGGATTQSIDVTQAGTFTLSIFDLYGNSVSKSIVVSSALQPSSPTISFNYIPNAAYQLTANEPSAASYLWSNGQTASTINVMSPALYSVVAINAFGCKSLEAEMNIGSITGQPCGTPDMLTAFDIIDTAATVAWNPAVTGDSFTLTYWVCGTTNYRMVSLPGNISSHRITDLVAGSSYSWKIQTNCLNLHKVSSNDNFTTMSSALPCGSIPSNLSATNINTNRAQLNWYKTIATKFIVRFRPVGTTTYMHRVYNGTAGSKGGIITNLTPNTMYEWSVMSNCAGINTAYSQPSYFTTIDPCGYMGAVTINNITPCKATIHWDNLSSMDTIRIRITTVATGSTRSILINGNNNTGEYTINGLRPNTAYLVDIRGKCFTGALGAWTAKAPFTTIQSSSKDSEENPFGLAGFPNPTSAYLTYTFNSDKDEDYVLKVCDMSGRQLLQESRYAENGSNGNEIDVNNYPPGLYLLILQKGTQTSHFRFAVQ